MKRNSLTILLLLGSAVMVLAGNIILIWSYDFDASPDVVAFRMYAVPGSNQVWQPGNVNATRMGSIAVGTQTGFVTNIQGSLNGLATGPWTFTVTAMTASGVESENATSVNGLVRPGKPTTLHVP